MSKLTTEKITDLIRKTLKKAKLAYVDLQVSIDLELDLIKVSLKSDEFNHRTFMQRIEFLSGIFMNLQMGSLKEYTISCNPIPTVDVQKEKFKEEILQSLSENLRIELTPERKYEGNYLKVSVLFGDEEICSENVSVSDLIER